MMLRVTLLLLIFFQPLLAADDDELEFSEDEAQYFAADLKCRFKDKQLVSIETKAMNDKIKKILKKRGDKSMYWTQGKRSDNPPDLYISGSDVAYPFRWMNGHRLSFRNFAQGRPNNAGPVTQARMFISVKYQNNNLLWYDSDYSGEFKYICQKPQKSTTKAPPEPKNEYGFDLTGYVKDNFEEAMADCKKEDEQKPIKLDSKKKSNALRDVCKANDNRIPYFLAMKRKSGKSAYKWLDGDRVKNAKWAPNQPSKDNDELCAVFYWEPEKNAILWASSACNMTSRVACEDA
ncbi:unnamed protein product [Phyllotreta striolata]|uniref:C-type lectin domain-containing protein n=1 Tax=Phyllotreta striolata TaxID=444603 RepID=A0A9N9TRL3_PHYSR|nr:unnamed protein product [Phyllotreta striolata]